MTTRTLLRVASFAATVLCAPVLGAQEALPFRVVVNAANPVSSLSRDDLSRLFLKRVVTWDGQRPVVLVEQPEASKIRQDFAAAVHRKDAAWVRSYWQTMIFAGRAVPPAERASDADVMVFVSGNRNAIGYVSAAAPLGGGLKVITIDR